MTTEYLLNIMLTIVSMLLSIILYQFKLRLKSLEDKAEKNCQDINKIQVDMSNRETMLQKEISAIGEKIIEEIHKTQLYAANTYVKREDCINCKKG